MDFSLTLSIFVALVAYRIAVPVLDNIAGRIWGNLHSTAIRAHVAGSASAFGGNVHRTGKSG
ncbi:MAG: hypothetical protein BGO63_03900 [Candidatus Accumulibacter sp. 66-26]|nr:MAG: hypothetical protein BGO63_03900 [Candidatus Accumulibacter sp. 66-26]